jgi:two-component system chemotaxis response regulator CheB
MNETIRVLVVDDSPFVCRLLTNQLQSAPGIEVVGNALNGPRALELIKELRPSVATLDLEMPGMSGLETLENIMQDCPTPIILVSGVSRRAATVTLQALELGAVDFVLKYTPGIDTDPDALREEIIAKVRVASQVKVVRSLRGRVLQERVAVNNGRLVTTTLGRDEDADRWMTDRIAPTMESVVVIGASTGGPLALCELLGNLPAEFPSAVLIVQHMPATFTRVLAAQLDRLVPLSVKEAEKGERLRAGVVYVAPGDYHLLLRPDLRIDLLQGPKIGGHRPSIDVTMQSVAQVLGSRAQGIVLTGMGSDGVLGLVAIRRRGGKTYTQDAATCVINGMPQRAIDKGTVDHIASPTEIARLLRGDLVRAWGGRS